MSLRRYHPSALDPDHPLYDLQSLAALTSTHPELLLPCNDPEAAEQALRTLHEHVGEDCFAELIELGPDLLLRAELPGLSFAAWLAVSRALSLQAHPACLLPGEGPTRLTCRLLGLLTPEALPLGDLCAVRWLDPEGAPVPEPCLARPPVHPVLLDLAAELRRALGPAWLPDDAVHLVQSARDGRFGLRLSLNHDDEPALATIAELVHQRASHRELRLAPDPSWTRRLGLELTLWLLVPPGEPLPTGDPGPFDGELLDAGPLIPLHRLEALAPVATHLPLAEQLAQRVPELTGEGQRWTRQHDRPAAAVTWTSPSPAALPDLPVPTRWTPAGPRGLLTTLDQLDVHPHRGARRWLVRTHDVLLAADLHEQCTSRPADPLDQGWLDALLPALQAAETEPAAAAGERWAEPVLDSEERAGLRLRLDRAHHLSAERYQATLAALGVELPSAEPFASVAFTASELWVTLWRSDHPVMGEPRRWGPAG